MLNLMSTEKEVVNAFRKSIVAKWGDRIRDIRVFGSRARGEGNEDSDIDILVVVDELSGGIRRAIYAAAADYLVTHDVILSPLVMSQERYDTMKSRERLLIQEIERDGVSL